MFLYPHFSRHQVSLKEVLYPTKEKVIVDIIIALSLIILSVSLPAFGIQAVLADLGLLEKIFNTFMALLLTLVIYYPLTCGLMHVYKLITREHHPYRRPEKINQGNLFWAILFILILNPLSISTLYATAAYVNNQIIKEPCGVIVTRFTSISPAQAAGITLGEIILDMNDNPIKTKADLTASMKNARPNEYVRVTTNQENYRVKVLQDAETGKNILGVIIKEKYCKKFIE